MAISSQLPRSQNCILIRYLIVGVLLFICSLTDAAQKESTEPEKGLIEHQEFYDACAHGKVDAVEEHLSRKPELITASTNDGETCLHLTAISKSLEIAKLLIVKGANTNQRVTHDEGLRMMPLSWHAWGGNVDIIQLLLDNGAEINADFDYSSGSNARVTATDIVSMVVGSSSGEEDDSTPETKLFFLSYELLRSRGGKTYEELFPDSPHGMSKAESKEDDLDMKDEF